MAIYFGEYPDSWKLGVITPLLKGGNPREEKNWRPITINCTMSKILETVLNNQISNHMESSGLYSLQEGEVSRHCTAGAGHPRQGQVEQGEDLPYCHD